MTSGSGRRAGWVWAGCLCAAVIVGQAAGADGTDGTADAETTFPFLTVREQTDARAPGRRFGDDRGVLTAGWCTVGGVELAALAAIAERAADEIADRFARVTDVRLAPPSAAIDAARVEGGPTILYTHGYSIDFADGCKRAAAVQGNTGIADGFLWFSWPSDGEMLNYVQDEVDLYWSVPDLADLIVGTADRIGAENLSVVGHSLGGRGMALALHDVAGRRPDLRIGEAVLIAPDMDFGVFEKLLPRLRTTVSRLTIYVSDADRPLDVSARLHGYPRLGQSGNPVERLGAVEVIDVSDLPPRSPSGHLYHLNDPVVGADLHALLIEGRGAAARDGLTGDGSNLWKLGTEP